MAEGITRENGEKPADGWGRVWIVVFLLLMGTPLVSLLPGIDEFRIETQGASLREQLSSIEESFSDLPLFERMRQTDQDRLAGFFGIGNSRVVVGEGDWLHYRPDIDATIGKGPFYVEPTSVARAPGLSPWSHPGPVIREFQSQLEERGIELWIVPIPTKSMVVSLGGQSRERLPEEYALLLAQFEESGVKVFDPSSLLSKSGSYLESDTHWTPEAMSRVARSLAKAVSGSAGETDGFERIAMEMKGDLANMLLSESSASGEKITLLRPRGENEKFNSDPASSWVVLGDSFVNVYDDPALGFPQWEGDGIGAGFASHLSIYLERPLHVIAVNGGGATGARISFAALPDKVVRSKEKVIWVLSARDLLLSEIPGRRAGIEWQRVEFRSGEEDLDSSGELVVTATLRERSEISDPNTSPYKNAIFSAFFDEVEVEKGTYSASEALVYFWAFQDRILDEASRIKIGQRYRLKLKRFPEEGPVTRAQPLDGIFRPDLDRYFADSIEEIE